MILRALSASVCGPRLLLLTFSDGTSGVAGLGPLLDGPIFEPLHDPDYFALAELDRVSGTVAWPNGADFAPEALHAATLVGGRQHGLSVNVR